MGSSHRRPQNLLLGIKFLKTIYRKIINCWKGILYAYHFPLKLDHYFLLKFKYATLISIKKYGIIWKNSKNFNRKPVPKASQVNMFIKVHGQKFGTYSVLNKQFYKISNWILCAVGEKYLWKSKLMGMKWLRYWALGKINEKCNIALIIENVCVLCLPSQVTLSIFSVLYTLLPNQ